jgi:hypothetical protein
MHIEPGLVSDSKIWLSYVTATGAGAYALKLAWDTVKDRGLAPLIGSSVATTALVFCFFEVFPHYPVGVSEVHLILGSTLFLIFGATPAAIGVRPAAAGPVLCAFRPASIRYERHHAAGATFCPYGVGPAHHRAGDAIR